jgi:hypothetical protein
VYQGVADGGLGIRRIIVVEAVDALEALRLVQTKSFHGSFLLYWAIT